MSLAEPLPINGFIAESKPHLRLLASEWSECRWACTAAGRNARNGDAWSIQGRGPTPRAAWDSLMDMICNRSHRA